MYIVLYVGTYIVEQSSITVVFLLFFISIFFCKMSQLISESKFVILSIFNCNIQENLD